MLRHGVWLGLALAHFAGHLALWKLHPSDGIWLLAATALGAGFFVGFFVYLRREDRRRDAR